MRPVGKVQQGEIPEVTNRPAKPPNGNANVFSDLAAEVRKQLLGAVIGALCGTGGLILFWLGPIKGFLMHKIYKENASLSLRISQSAIHVGDEFTLFVEALPSSPIPVSDGVLEIALSDQSLQLRRGLSDPSAPEFKGAVILPVHDPPVVRATSTGQFTISATLKTRFGQYSTQKSVSVLPANQPTLENLSGEWQTRMGPDLGKMELIHRAPEVSGVFVINNETMHVKRGS